MKYLSITLFLLPLLLACHTNQAQTDSDLNATQFHEALQTTAEIQIVDVRTPGEFTLGHLENSINIDYNHESFQEKIDKLDKSKSTFVYCMSGGRSASALKKLKQSGFVDVYNLDGGILAWRAEKLPLSHDGEAAVNGLSMDEFMAKVGGDTPVLVDFGATWCGPCKKLKPRVAELARSKGDNLNVIYIDVDQNKELADALGIRSIPLLHYYKNGKLKDKRSGLVSMRELERLTK